MKYLGWSQARFEPSEGGTRITMTADLEGKGVVWKSMTALSQGPMKGQADLERLRRLIESG